MSTVVLVRALVVVVAIIGGLLVIRLLSSTRKAVKTEELNQTKQGEPD